MPNIIETQAGLRVKMPVGISIIEESRSASAEPALPIRSPRISTRTPGVVPMPAAVPSNPGLAAAIDPVANALQGQDLVLVDSIRVSTAAGTFTRALGEDKVEVEVDLESNESAVALLEQAGLYSWHFKATESAPTGAVARRMRQETRAVAFHLRLDGSEQGAARRGILSDVITDRARVFIFKFAGRFLLQHGALFLERKVHTGLVVVSEDNPQAWEELADFSKLKLPPDRPARILLFVHGTFSSTRGGFGALGATPWGRAFLAAARANYDVVVGFDHPTLSVDPLANATELLRSLERRDWKQPASIDVISHSRGGITLRSLIERLLPLSSLPVRVERAVFVGAVNGGTELAEPKNWEAFINLYTNMAVGACKAIEVFGPQGAFAGTLIAELLKSVGALARALAEEAVTEQAMPGLAAMQPKGAFITELNKSHQSMPAVAQRRSYAITSEFRANLALEVLDELPRKLLLALANGAVDQLMGVANDLVVNTDSMTRLDADASVFVKDILAFGENGVVYHTNYFLQPQVTDALARWFELESPATANPARTRGGSQRGISPLEPVPARMNVNLLVMAAEDTVDETLKQIEQKSPAYVVVDRMLHEGLRHYAFKTEEVIHTIAGKGRQSLLDALNLHETDASNEGPVDNLRPPDAGNAQPSLRRAVAMDGPRVVGVMEATVAPIPIKELAERAKLLGTAKSKMEEIVARKVMPNFVKRGPAAELLMADSAAEAVIGRSRGGISRGVPTTGAPSRPSQPAASTGAEIPGPATVDCNILAEIDDEVTVGKTTWVDVTLSRGITAAIRAASAAASVEVAAVKKLMIEIIPKKNFVVLSATSIEADVPTAKKLAIYSFEVNPTDPGDGEIVLRIRQELAVLATLSLHCRITAAPSRVPLRRIQEFDIQETTLRNQPRHKLTIMEGERGGQKFYQYILESPSLNLYDRYESKPLLGSREEFIKGVFEDIEGRYLSAEGDYDEFQKELREVGGDLWSQLFPEKLQEALWRCRDQIDSILVFSEEPFIPWELIHLKEPGKGLAPETRFFGQMGLVRWLHNMGWPTEDLRARPGRCHFVIPHYPHPNFRLLGAEAEEPFLRGKFGAQPVDPHPGSVRTFLEKTSFDLLHFACHGGADSQDIARAELLLEGRIEGASYITEKLRATTIENLNDLGGEDGTRPIVALNACQAGRAGYKMTSIGGFSRAFLGKGAGMFIAALWAVGDMPARAFTENLYQALLDKKTLAEASNSARQAARAAREATWLAYTVYGNPVATLKA